MIFKAPQSVLCLLMLLSACGKEPPPGAITGPTRQPPSPSTSHPIHAKALPPTTPADKREAPPATDPDRAAEAQAINEAAVKLFAAGELEDALGEFRRAYDLDPQNPTIKRNIARCYGHIANNALDQRRFREAARDFKLAEDFDPKDPSYGLARGQALNEGRLFREAIAVLEAQIKDFPTQARAYSLLGIAYYNVGRNRDALDSWRQALKLDPKDAIAKAYQDKVSVEESVEENLDEDFGAPHFNLKFDGRNSPELGRLIGPMLEGAYENVGRLLGVHPEGETAVVIYPGKSFQKVTGSHSWVKALYDGKIRVPGRGLSNTPASELQQTFQHEYTHALIHRLAGRHCPVWLHEGIAQIADGRSLSIAQAMVKRTKRVPLKLLSGSFVSIKNENVVRLLYATAHAFTAWLAGRAGGLWKFEALLRDLGTGKKLDQAFSKHFGEGLSTLYEEWSRR